MTTKTKSKFEKIPAQNKIIVTREFDAPVDDVWSAWTEAKYLEQWWAPKPWKAETKKMDFKVGGHWLYAMVGPDGSKHWSRVDYTNIDAKNSFQVIDAFCDETGLVDKKMPSANWTNTFTTAGEATKVTIEIQYQREEDYNKILEMGFEEGFAMGLDQLEEVLAKN